MEDIVASKGEKGIEVDTSNYHFANYSKENKGIFSMTSKWKEYDLGLVVFH